MLVLACGLGSGLVACVLPSAASAACIGTLSPEACEGAQRIAQEVEERELRREAQERAAKEAAAREAAAREAKEREEQQARALQQREEEQRSRCTVPALEGDSLAMARTALRKANCALGTVRTPRRHRGRLVVTGQNRPAGEELAHGAHVGVTLGLRHRARHP